ncbi:DUF7538 family protein [Halorubrum aethiopicum]|uniref:DUF7538 family protein n=1 Tax=Halorubrum aethiopicum TaxID=1758255 RepID=UPI00082D8013|nr:dehydrogenase [Halorubrum aethiopicum]
MHDEIAALVRQEGWRAEGAAARVHYDGGGDRVAIEFYAAAERVLYWTVPEGAGTGTGSGRESENRGATADAGTVETNTAGTAGTDTAGTAAPIPRETVPDPLRRRIREDLDAAGIDPDAERRGV